jgi:hypothetical protein
MAGLQVTPEVSRRQRQAFLAGVRAVLHDVGWTETTAWRDAARVRSVELVRRVDRDRDRIARAGPAQLIRD